MNTLESYLCGAWTPGSGPAREIHDATTGAVIASVASGGLDLKAALHFGRTVGGPALRALTFAQRAEILDGLAKLLHAEREALIDASRHGGTTRGDAKFDIDGAAGTLAYYAALGRGLGERKVLLDGDSEPVLRSKRFVGQHVRMARLGVAVHINAFNFPAWGMAEKLACSLLAGVPALSKPGTPTAPLAVAITKLWVDSGLLPEGSFQLLAGGAGDLLDHLGPQDVVAFTGSAATGRAVRGHANVLKQGVVVNVEADSLNAAVLGPDVAPGSDTWLMFVADVVRDMTQKAGQKCTAIRRVLVPLAVVDEVQEALIDQLSGFQVGDPAEKSTRVGPVASPSALADVKRGLEGLSAAASCVWRAEGVPEGGCFVAPAIYRTDAGVDAQFVHEHEVFGPVTTLLTYSGEAEEAVAIVAAGGGGLVCSLYSDDLAFAGPAVLGLAPWHGRLHWGSAKVYDQSAGPGTVLPGFVHGGPGKAGGGRELGGLRGLDLYLQTTAIQADRGLLERLLG